MRRIDRVAWPQRQPVSAPTIHQMVTTTESPAVTRLECSNTYIRAMQLRRVAEREATMARQKTKQRGRRSQSRSASKQIVQEVIEEERGRMHKSVAVLDCLAFSLLYEDYHLEPVNFSDAARVARDLICDSIDNLDSINIDKRAAERKTTRKR